MSRMAATEAYEGRMAQHVAEVLLAGWSHDDYFLCRFSPWVAGVDLRGKDFRNRDLGFDDDPHDNGRSSDTYWVWAANFMDCELDDVLFDGSDLYGCSFVNAVVTGASFKNSDVRSVDFTKAVGLHPNALDGAVIDDYTKWPDGFDPSQIPNLRKLPGYSSAWLRAKGRNPEKAKQMDKSVRKMW